MSKKEQDAGERIDAYIAGQEDWKGEVLARLRELILEAEPGLAESWKWNSPVWSKGGNVVSIGGFKTHVKVNFFKGAELADPRGLFNAGLDAKASRSIDLAEGDALDEDGFRELVRAAVALG